MTDRAVFHEISSFIAQHFGASIASGYYLLGLDQTPSRQVTSPDALQSLADRLCERPTWLVATSIDPALITNATQVELRTITTEPEWSAPEQFIQYLAVLNGPVDIDALRRSGEHSLHALALIDPAREIVLNVTSRHVYATPAETLSAILDGSPMQSVT